MSILIDKKIKPDDSILEGALGKSFEVWKNLKTNLKAKYNPVTEEWKFYGEKSGWLMKFLYKKRNLFFFSPQQDEFMLAFIFGDKAVDVITAGDFSENIKNELHSAKKYAEGRGLRVNVSKQKDINLIFKLVEVKVNN